MRHKGRFVLHPHHKPGGRGSGHHEHGEAGCDRPDNGAPQRFHERISFWRAAGSRTKAGTVIVFGWFGLAERVGKSISQALRESTRVLYASRTGEDRISTDFISQTIHIEFAKKRFQRGAKPIR